MNPATSTQDSTITLSEAEIRHLYNNLGSLSRDEQEEVLRIAEELERRRTAQKCRDDLISFCKHMQPDYKVGKHHRILANLLMEIAEGKKDRICVNIPPRHGKSQLVSIYFPAWFLGRHPDKKVLMVSHTTDLAVDFGRKVRNIIDSDAYRDIFPTVSLAADSKSAGRWNTGVGGEYYACIRRYTLVATDRGDVPAYSVRIGDRLAGAGGWVTVQEIFDSQHSATFVVKGLHCSAEHPIWTMNRGWVQAQKLCPNDLLCVESTLDRMKALFKGVLHGYLEHPNVPQVVQHKEPLHQSKKRKVERLRRAWHNGVRSVVGVFKFLYGYGGATNTSAYCGAYQQQRPVFPGELPVGNRAGAAEQQAEQQSIRGAYLGATCAAYGDYSRSSVLPEQGGDTPTQPEAAHEEFRAYRAPENLGWVRRTAAQILTRSGSSTGPTKPAAGFKKYLAGAGEAAQKLCGLLLGVRRVGGVRAIEHDAPRNFINFRTDGDHTFFADGVLTHNCGVGSALAGRGADLLLVDDPHSEQDVLNGNFDVFDKAYEWFTYGARTRLMPGGRVAVVQTRWHMDDLTGRLTRDMGQNEFADQYEVVEFPALFEVEDKATGELVHKPLWPEFFDVPALLRTKASMPVFQWNSQYQQQPTAEEGAIIKREWWKIWEAERPPQCNYLIMTLDAAAEKTTRSDFTAITTWGVFFHEPSNSNQIILLNSVKDRVEFPELKQMAQEEYDYWKPDSFVVEKKSSGTPLYQELRRTGMIIQEYTPHRGTGDKFARLNSVADIIKSGLVWVPQTRWAEELVEEVAGFPFMSHDDLVDCTTMALMRFRQGGFIRLATDEPEPLKQFKSRRGGTSRYY
jgi:predicted phage terminase large subunit-like protein